MTMVPVRGSYVDVLGEPAPEGSHVNFRARPAAVYDADTMRFIIGQSRTVTLDGTGAFDVELRATDDPQLSPVGWTYEVREWIGGQWLRPAFDIDVPAAAADDGIELGEVAPASPAEGATGVVTLPTFTTAGRPAASVGTGACYYDTTVGRPVFSDGTTWRDAAGTAV